MKLTRIGTIFHSLIICENERNYGSLQKFQQHILLIFLTSRFHTHRQGSQKTKLKKKKHSEKI